MELRGSLGGSVRLFLQRDAVDGGEIGSERPHVSSTGAIVAPLLTRQGLEIRVLHTSDTRFCFLTCSSCHENDGTSETVSHEPRCRIGRRTTLSASTSLPIDLCS